jgi:hypothetical protein
MWMDKNLFFGFGLTYKNAKYFIKLKQLFASYYTKMYSFQQQKKANST